VQDAAEKIATGDFPGATQSLEQANTPEAEFKLATLYKDGLGGVKRDPEKAVSLLKDAAEAGLPRAETMLGLCYAEGEGVEANPAAALGWYRKAAAHGDTTAAELLGTAYAAGSGIDQDLVEAYMWFTLAGNHGDEGAGHEN
jgi:TPR repeat protein